VTVIFGRVNFVKLQRFVEHRKMPWINGRGTTHEVAVAQVGDAWDWSLSIAEVSEDGPFSVVPDVDRVLVVATGNGMTLTVDGHPQKLARFEQLLFRGESETLGELTNGPVYDLNLMVNRASDIGKPLIEVKHLQKNEALRLDSEGLVLAMVVLEGAIAMETAGDGFPFNPVKARASRLDAFLPTFDLKSKTVSLYAATQSVVAVVSLT
jgi:environmental stress-induced protein Ves